MFITFETLKYKNFLSVGNAFVEIHLNDAPKTLVIGKNGSAKSSILDALYFALYGRAFRNISKGKLINSINKRELLVELTFTVGSYPFKVIRGMNPDRFEVYQDDQLIVQDASVRDYQNQFEKNIIQMNRRTFSQIVVLGSANYKPFMALTASERREVIEDMLDLKIFAQMNVILRDKIQQNRLDNGIVQARIDSSKRLLNAQMDLLNRNDTNIQEESDVLDKQIKLAVNFGKHLLSDVESNKKIVNSNVDNNVELQLVKQQEQVRNNKFKIDLHIKQLNADISFFKEHNTCPTCYQNITDEFRQQTLINKTSDLQDDVQHMLELDKEQAELAMSMQQVQEDRKRRETALKDIAMIRSQMVSLKWKIQEYQSQKSKLKTPASSAMIRQTIADIEQSMIESESELKRLLVDADLYSFASTLLKDGGIKARIVSTYIPILNKLINKYLSSMDFFVQFEIDENFNEKIRSRYRDDFEYNSFSQGEKLRIDIAMLFSWRELTRIRNSVQTNLLLMDEVMDGSIDADGAEEFMKLMDKLSDRSNIMIISHRGDQIGDRFDRVLRFEKHGNYSLVEELH